MAVMPKPAAVRGAPAMAAPAMAEDAMMADDAMMAEDAPMDEGYVIEIVVKADGTFAVSKEDLRVEAAEGEGEEAMSYDSLGQALKAVMDLVKNNPVSESEQSQFDAGYGANAA
jgi:hypothetical protein